MKTGIKQLIFVSYFLVPNIVCRRLLDALSDYKVIEIGVYSCGVAFPVDRSPLWRVASVKGTEKELLDQCFTFSAPSKLNVLALDHHLIVDQGT